MTASMTPNELKQTSPEQVELIDVRTPAEFQEVHVEFAKNIPLDQLDPQSFKNRSNDRQLVFICKSGSRGQMACKKLCDAGVENVLNLEGGTQAAVDAGLPVKRGKKVISLERQVRIAAGALVFIGTGLSLLHPAWLVVPAFVGAGLVFAGVTDTCGMGMMLAKMPWNQVKTCSSGAQCSVEAKQQGATSADQKAPAA